MTLWAAGLARRLDEVIAEALKTFAATG